MTDNPDFAQQIDAALGPGLAPKVRVQEVAPAALPSCFAVTDLAVASVAAAAKELAVLTGAQQVTRR